MAIQGLLCFHINLIFFGTTSVKNAIGNLIGIALNLLIALCSRVVLSMILPILEYGIYFQMYYPQFPSSVSYSFQSTGLLPL